MSVLVAFASRYGATRQIAQQIGAVLTVAGHDVRVRETTAVADLEGHEAVVLGGALYHHHWMDQATAFAERHQAALSIRPVWLFSSGLLAPVGMDQRPASDLERLSTLLGARGHRAFGGELVVRRLDLVDRAARLRPSTRRALQPGDSRDWVEIDLWAHDIAAELTATPHH